MRAKCWKYEYIIIWYRLYLFNKICKCQKSQLLRCPLLRKTTSKVSWLVVAKYAPGVSHPIKSQGWVLVSYLSGCSCIEPLTFVPTHWPKGRFHQVFKAIKLENFSSQCFLCLPLFRWIILKINTSITECFCCI